jgi:hypothetical protein
MPIIAALIACAILLGLAILQGALAAGAPLGRYAWGGQYDVLPAHLKTNARIIIPVYAVFALVLLQGVDVVTLFSGIAAQVAVWALTVYFFVTFVMAAASRSRHEQILMCVASVILAALSLFIAIAGHVTT